MERGSGAGFLKPYVLKSLPEHERFIALGRFPWVFRAASWLVLFSLGLMPMVGLFALYFSDRLTLALAVLCLAISLLGIAIFLMMEAYIATTEFGLTSQRLVIKRGLFGRQTVEMPLQALENIQLHQSFFSRLLSYGRLEVAGSGGGGLQSPPIQNPMAFRELIDEASADVLREARGD